MSYLYECPECKQKTLLCYDSLDGSKTTCDCVNCGYHSETSLDEIEDEDDDDERLR